jgi:hypothetical protein
LHLGAEHLLAAPRVLIDGRGEIGKQTPHRHLEPARLRVANASSITVAVDGAKPGAATPEEQPRRRDRGTSWPTRLLTAAFVLTVDDRVWIPDRSRHSGEGRPRYARI